jgi:hypothetical protein
VDYEILDLTPGRFDAGAIYTWQRTWLVVRTNNTTFEVLRKSWSGNFTTIAAADGSFDILVVHA